MKCPHCDVNLLMTDRQGVEIDYCPECRGVWLDRGELDKIVERSQLELGGSGGGVAVVAAPPREERSRDRDDRSRDRDDRYRSDDRYREDDRYRDDGRRDDDRRHDDRYPPKKKKRSSFLEDIFDF
jgi:Zn-finger nucleic acid-binding protein